MNIQINLLVTFTHEWMSEYISSYQVLTNECTNIFETKIGNTNFGEWIYSQNIFKLI